MVKLVKDDALAELDIYDYLLDDLSDPKNHTLPCEVIHADPPVVIMPFVANMVHTLWLYAPLYDIMYQVLEVRPNRQLVGKRSLTIPSHPLGHGILAPAPRGSHGARYNFALSCLYANLPPTIGLL